MADLDFHPDTVQQHGDSLCQDGNDLTTTWDPECDLGDGVLNHLMTSLRTTVRECLLGAAMEVYGLGQAAVDAAALYRETDRSLL